MLLSVKLFHPVTPSHLTIEKLFKGPGHINNISMLCSYYCDKCKVRNAVQMLLYLIDVILGPGFSCCSCALLLLLNRS